MSSRIERNSLRRKVARFSKYKAKPTELAGYSFASKGEASCFQLLKLLERAGELTIKQVQPHVHLSAAAILYVPDFLIDDLILQREVWVEFKGFETPEWRIKRKLWTAYGPGLLRIYKGYGAQMRIHEELEGGLKK